MGDFDFGKMLTKWTVGIMMLLFVTSININGLKNWVDKEVITSKNMTGITICFGILLFYISVQLVPSLKKIIITPINEIEKGLGKIIKNFFS